jgi:hypothetical protein
MKRKYWTAEEEEQLIELYDKYTDKDGNFLAYKVKKKELISGRNITSHRSKLERDWSIRTIGSARMISHKIDYKSIYEAHLDGCTTRQIGKDFGISHQSVRTALDRYKRVNGISSTEPKTGWTAEEDASLVDFVINNTRWDGHVLWINLNGDDVLPGRTKVAMNKRWIKHLKADRQWNGKTWIKVATPEPKTTTTKVKTTKVKTTRRTFLWGAYTIESAEE